MAVAKPHQRRRRAIGADCAPWTDHRRSLPHNSFVSIDRVDMDVDEITSRDGERLSSALDLEIHSCPAIEMTNDGFDPQYFMQNRLALLIAAEQKSLAQGGLLQQVPGRHANKLPSRYHPSGGVGHTFGQNLTVMVTLRQQMRDDVVLWLAPASADGRLNVEEKKSG